MNGKIEYVITYHYMYRQIMITFGWYLLVIAVQETCKANFVLRTWYRVQHTHILRLFSPQH